jgi:hypothetical protein
VIFSDIDRSTKRDLRVMRVDGERKPAEFLKTGSNLDSARFSPDARYVAYVSDESGTNDVYVTTFPDPKVGKWPISSGGGYQPRWRRDGRELLYFTSDGNLMSVDVALIPSFRAGIPKALFRVPIFGGGGTLGQNRWDLTADGQRFLINTIGSGGAAPITVVLNWQAGLKK